MIALWISIALGLAAVAAFVAVSPGKPRPIVDTLGSVVPDSISEKTFFLINGARQGAFIKGRSRRSPVLLYLHGGLPDYFLTQRHPTGLEELFTVVWWEQRGSGLSYAAADPSTPITAEQLVADTIALTRRLCRRFGKDRIYLMGHSGGTFIGLRAIQRAPELFHAYIGVAQITDQLESEQLAYDYMLDRFRSLGEARWVERLEATGVDSDTPPAYMRLRDPAMHRLGVGTMHDMTSILRGIFVPSLLFREYTVREKWHLWAAKARSGASAIWNAVVSTDLRQEVPEVRVPVYLLHGIHDRTCSYDLARDYAATLSAPVKGFYSFRESAHSPIFEEPERVQRIIREDVLRGMTNLADIL